MALLSSHNVRDYAVCTAPNTQNIILAQMLITMVLLFLQLRINLQYEQQLFDEMPNDKVVSPYGHEVLMKYQMIRLRRMMT